MFYLIIFIILFIFAVCELHCRTGRLHGQMLTTAWAMLVLIAGLRYETGGDWEAYRDMFNSIPPLLSSALKNEHHVEWGFYLLCAMVKQLGGSLQVVYFLAALFNITLITKGLRKYTAYPIIGLLTYYCVLFFTMEMLFTRQGIAVSLCFYAMQYVYTKKIWKYIIIAVIAAMFHKVALLMIPSYFIFRCQFKARTMIIAVVVGVVLMLSGAMGWFTWMVVNALQIVKPTATQYLNERTFAIARYISIGFFTNVLLFLFVMLKYKEIKQMPYGSIFLNMLTLSIMVYYYGYELVEVSNRIRFFYMIGIIVIFPMLIEVYVLRSNRQIVFAGIVLYSFMLARTIFMEHPARAAYNPYQCYLYHKWTGKKSTGHERLHQSYKYTEEERLKKQQK